MYTVKREHGDIPDGDSFVFVVVDLLFEYK
jgi:hypothetical protein